MTPGRSRSRPSPRYSKVVNADLLPPLEDERFRNPVEARRKAMDYLARREHGRAELTDKLVRAGFEPGVAAAAVARLGEDGLQDERRFVENFVQSRIGQGKGPVRIQAELRQRGLDDGVLEDVLAAVEQDWFELARQVRARKFGAARPGDFPEKARQMRFLQYRGFEPAQIQAAVAANGDA